MPVFCLRNFLFTCFMCAYFSKSENILLAPKFVYNEYVSLEVWLDHFQFVIYLMKRIPAFYVNLMLI